MMNSALPESVTGEGSMDVSVGVEQVNISGASNFEEIAFKLKEAMEVAME